MITVIIPVLNESPTIASVVGFAWQAPGVTEVVVVDDGSIDGTPQRAQAAGARVVTSTLLGKGASMEDGMRVAQNEVLLYLDGDLSGLRDDLVQQMTAPILSGQADFVKARFSRNAGRVTILTARPLIQVFFPELAHLKQPLGGIIAARRSVLQTLHFETDYGVDIGLVLDASASGARLVQVDIGHIHHDSQPLEVLGDMAKQVTRVILNRAARYGRLGLHQLREVEEIERRTQAELPVILTRLGQPERLALLDMDGTLLEGRFIAQLAERIHKTPQLTALLDSPGRDADGRTQAIAALCRGVPKDVFEEVARAVPLMPGATELVVALRQHGYRVGIVSDSFFVATEIVRRRVFADFSIAHLLRFQQGIATGEVTLSPAMQHPEGCREHPRCKLNVLLHLCRHFDLEPEQVFSVGDSDPDACMLRASGLSIAFQPKSRHIESAAQQVVHGSLLEAIPHIPQAVSYPA